MECICGGRTIEGNRAKEHVVPQWLLEHLGVALETFYQQVVRSDDGSIVGSRDHATQSFVQGRVCSICNGGWMSDLESPAKSIMIPLMDGKARYSDSPTRSVGWCNVGSENGVPDFVHGCPAGPRRHGSSSLPR